MGVAPHPFPTPEGVLSVFGFDVSGTLKLHCRCDMVRPPFLEFLYCMRCEIEQKVDIRCNLAHFQL